MYISADQYLEIQAKLPILCVDTLIIFESKCLLLKRANPPAKGEWWFPGGRVLKDELISEAATRKSFAETNLAGVFVDIISVEETIFPETSTFPFKVHTVNVCCRVRVDDISSLNIDKDHSDWIFVDTIEASKLGLHLAVFNPLSRALSRQP